MGLLRRLRSLLVVGAALLMLLCVGFLVVGSVPDPVALGFSLVAAVVPAGVYAALVLRLDRNEVEPAKALWAAFAWGAIGAVVFSVLVGLVVEALLDRSMAPGSSEWLSIVLGAPLVEESFKAVALLAILLLYRHELDNVLDGLVYGALVGLGFAMTENILYFGDEYLENGLRGLTQLFLARAVIGGLGHAVYTACTGAAIGWARQRYRRGVLRFVVPLLGLAAAVLLHALWNGGALVVSALVEEQLGFLPSVAVLALIILVPAALVLALIARVARDRELRVVREALAAEVEAGTLSGAELDTLADAGRRRDALKNAHAAGGRRHRQLQAQFFQTATELAFRRYHLSRGETLKPGQQATEPVYRFELARLREALTTPAEA